jgi:C-terminal processing protease CtpA/Prc
MAEPHTIAIIEAALARLASHYVFPDRAAVASEVVWARVGAGDYDGLGGESLCERLTRDLDQTCRDAHLRLIWSAQPQPPYDNAAEPEMLAAMRARFRRENQGIRCVEHLAGNVGYLDLRAIPEAAHGGPAIAAAMRLVADTGALLIDLRHNRGGAPDGVALWCSFLLEEPDVHLDDLYDRAAGTTRQLWTTPYLPGPRYGDRPVYLLTASTTFSAGEEFAYALRTRDRAILVGERTRGGAHPTNSFQLTPQVEICVPFARTVNPVTGTNWEGVGVEPHLPVPAAQALALAHRHALTSIVDRSAAGTAEHAEAAGALAEDDRMFIGATADAP